MSCSHLRAQLYVRTCRAVPQFTPPSASASASASAPASASASASASARPHSHHLSVLFCTKERKKKPPQHLIHPSIHPVTIPGTMPYHAHTRPSPAPFLRLRSSPHTLALRRRVTCRSSHSLLLRPTLLLHPARNSRNILHACLLSTLSANKRRRRGRIRFRHRVNPG
jgi:hypothetical protein